MLYHGYKHLRRRLLLTFLLLALTPLVALGLFCIDRIDAMYAEKITAGLEAVTSSKRRAVDTFLVERVAQIKTLAYTHSYADLTNPDRLSRIFSVMQANGRSFLDLGVIGLDGRHVSYVGPYNLSDANYTETPWFREVLQKGVYVSDGIPQRAPLHHRRAAPRGRQKLHCPGHYRHGGHPCPAAPGLLRRAQRRVRHQPGGHSPDRFAVLRRRSFPIQHDHASQGTP